ncbi:Laminin subunit beta-1 [Armadillidium nasatum]|uniref:Laminin subunit beta-1 n=1 Tax=Armadillidium nasatum TaxID=96803 RepID=A0A5N5SLV8_9CRUS|nr:Laminin subunit beta-1 [Armadillidium nasatum]
MKPSVFYICIFIIIAISSQAFADSEAKDSDPHRRGAVFYGNSRVASNQKRQRGRGRTRRPLPSNQNTSFFSEASDDRSPSSRNDEREDDGRALFSWNGNNYEGQSPGTRIISRKKTTKTTKITKTRIDGSSEPKTTSYTYTYTYPGSSVTTFRNTSTFITKTGQKPISESERRRISSTYESSSGSSYGGDSYNKQFSSSVGSGGSVSGSSQSAGKVDSSYRIGVGEEYLKNTEEDVYDYEEEVYDPEFARGPVVSPEDLLHPFVIRGFGAAKGMKIPVMGGRVTPQREISSSADWTNYRQLQLVDYRKKTRLRSWWQSENGKEDVSIRLDLEAEFHLTHIIMTFRTFRPSAMLIERSHDFGKTWKVYRYFAENCGESFPGIPQGPARLITDVVCESRYSEVEPSHNGEVIFRVLQPNLKIKDPYGDEVKDLLRITNLRVNFTKLHTLGDQLLDTRPEIKEKYYYAIYDMVVRGSCSCNGHASECLPLPGVQDQENMVHGLCKCTHNTTGLNCERCADFYNDQPWRPGVKEETNACKRCECNNHATRCHFDNNVYEATGKISGGVCDECQHNTQGRNCESCIPYYYRNMARSLDDPNVCQACNCDLRGTTDDGICDSRTDAEAGIVSGRCHCKENVDGLKCDRCKAGYWNFTGENPVGCQDCSCDILGTLNNAGCDAYTGKCQCKLNVVGRDCNQCRPQHFGLSEHPNGCQPCNCDKGGAFDNDCDVISGQCRCRPHVTGRQCDRPEEGYFVPYLNYLTFEAELARGSENCQVVMREPYRDGRETTWTGIGFMRVFDDSHLEFDVENVESSMDYDLVIKYEPQFRNSWDGVKVRIERPGPVDPNGPCANARTLDDKRTLDLSDRAREKTVFPTVCLESGKNYKIVLEFSRSNAYTDTPSASILIDSVILIPRAEQLPFYSGSLEKESSRQEYQHYRCSEPFYTGQGLSSLPETCVEDHLDSIGLYLVSVMQREVEVAFAILTVDSAVANLTLKEEGAIDVLLGLTVSDQKVVHPANVAAKGHWITFAINKLVNVNVDQILMEGSVTSVNQAIGTSLIARDANVMGMLILVIYALDFAMIAGKTQLDQIVLCKEGFYGDPRLEVGIACRPCPCPGTVETQHSFASRCSLDSRTKDVICECEEGYAGSRCDICADNYYGNPEVPGGRCQPCDCSNNIDISKPGNCNPRSVCSCNILGTNTTVGPCDHLSGQCHCHPNVVGVECDRCSPNHWKLASGIGCEHCNCDPIGSYEEQCNEYTGQCNCKPGFGGRQCDQCQTNFLWKPKNRMFTLQL